MKAFGVHTKGYFWEGENAHNKTSLATGHKLEQIGYKLRIDDNIVISMLTRGEESSEFISRSTDMWAPFAIDAKGGEKLIKEGVFSYGEHELLSSMTKGEIVDWIVIDSNKGLLVAIGLSVMPPRPLCGHARYLVWTMLDVQLDSLWIKLGHAQYTMDSL